MYAQKSFAGLQQVGTGTETEPRGDIESLDGIKDLLTNEAYDLFDARQMGATVDLEALVTYLQTGEVTKDIVSFPVKEQEQSKLFGLLEEFLEEHLAEITSSDITHLRDFITSLEVKSRGTGGSGHAQNETHMLSLKAIRENMIRKGIEITDRGAFILSLEDAIVRSDQGGLESILE